ncbi:MAG: molybdenum cofactor guanylyltransferase [FCB group bacterium]|nr:molybdenum cofactor guanylyltransferase [FCB group bacterium]
MDKFDCAILAGGKSSRMASDKAFLKLDGKAIIEHVVTTVRRVLPKPKIITNTPGKYEFLNLPCYTDIIKNTGPLGGIYTALINTTARRCLILACDLPFITETLIKIMSEENPAFEVVAVDAGRGIEPLCAVYDISCIPKIKAQIDSGNYKVSDIYDSAHTKILRLKEMQTAFDDEVLFNINTPDEYETAQKINQKKRNR